MKRKWLKIEPKRWWMLWAYPQCWILSKKLNKQEQYDDFYKRVKGWKMTEGTVEFEESTGGE